VRHFTVVGRLWLQNQCEKRLGGNAPSFYNNSGCKIIVGNDDGETPLHSAVDGNNVADVKLLLKKNAEVNIQNSFGNTPLHISTLEGLCDISQLFIDSGCNKNLTNREGKTPLDLEPFPYFSPYPLYRGDSEEAKGNEGYAYASQKGFRLKSFFESEDSGNAWMNQPTRSTLSSPIVSKLKEPKSVEGSGILLEERQELLSSVSRCIFGLVPRYNKKSQPHSPSESVVYPENRRHTTLSRSTFVSRNEYQATRLLVQKLLSHYY